jgi:hypothetical protein
MPAVGTWSADSYRLLRTDEPSQAVPPAAAGHRVHGGHRGSAEGDGAAWAAEPAPWAPAAPDPDGPYGPYACAPDDAPGADGDDRVFEGEL